MPDYVSTQSGAPQPDRRKHMAGQRQSDLWGQDLWGQVLNLELLWIDEIGLRGS
jgi:hypothetical protein